MKRFKILLFVAFLLMPLVAYSGNVDTFGVGAKATALGGAFAAKADDFSAMYYNPAGLVQIKRPEVSLGASFIVPNLNQSVSFKNNQPLTGHADSGSTSTNDGSPLLIAPAGGIVYPTTVAGRPVAFGIGSYVPFGMKLKWSANPAANLGAYNGYKVWYSRFVFAAPTVSVALTDKLLVGAGLEFGKSRSGVDRDIYLSPELQALAIAGHSPLTKYIGGSVRSDFKDHANWSFNIGVIYKFSPKLQVGLTYRGKTTTKFSGPTDFVDANGKTIDSATGSVSIDHPEQIQGGIYYQFTPRLSGEVDLVWTHWSRIKSYTVTWDRTPELLQIEGKTRETFVRNWKNTTQLKFGVSYILSKVVTLRGGFYYDPTPITNEGFDMAWPDADKISISTGAGIKLSGHFKLDLAYQFMFTKGSRDLPMGTSSNLNSSYGSDALGENPQASAKGKGVINNVAMTMTYKF